MTWHRRHGHVNFQVLVKMKNNKEYGIDFDDNDKEIKEFEFLARGKQTRRQFPISETISKLPLELIHSDLADGKFI